MLGARAARPPVSRAGQRPALPAGGSRRPAQSIWSSSRGPVRAGSVGPYTDTEGRPTAEAIVQGTAVATKEQFAAGQDGHQLRDRGPAGQVDGNRPHGLSHSLHQRPLRCRSHQHHPPAGLLLYPIGHSRPPVWDPALGSHVQGARVKRHQPVTRRNALGTQKSLHPHRGLGIHLQGGPSLAGRNPQRPH